MDKSLTNAEKVAVLLLMAGEEAATEILANMTDEEVQLIGDAMNRMGLIDDAVCQAVLAEFSGLMQNKSGASQKMPQAVLAGKSPAEALVAEETGLEGVTVRLSDGARKAAAKLTRDGDS